MYEVWVPVRPDTWLSGHYVSDWAEVKLQLSGNLKLACNNAGGVDAPFHFLSGMPMGHKHTERHRRRGKMAISNRENDGDRKD